MKVKQYIKQKLAKALDLVALKEKLERLEGQLLSLNKEFERLKAEAEQLKLEWKQSR
ncbi:MAG: hypothetical protein SW833_27750 [Cyanobacteriota bacterium]|nr:hypothetical protein [Cyanobacteriota bacterium]